MKHRPLALLLSLLAVANISNELGGGVVLGISTEEYVVSTIQNNIKLQTETAFDQTEIVEYENIPFSIKYEDDGDMEYGIEKILKPGKDGTRTLTYLLTYWIDEEINKQLINTEVAPPVIEKVAKGTKIVWREHMTPDVGGVKYWYKLRVWATKYDANCYGCTGRTYTGKEVVKGICATDPRVIPLGTNFYVDGYGLCRAEDIGGAIKGNDVDLGFPDASKAAWGAAYTDIYLLTNAPQ